MKTHLCPHCNGLLPSTKTARTKAPYVPPTRPDGAWDSPDVKKYYASIAPLEDVRFFLKTQLAWSGTSERAYGIWQAVTDVENDLLENRGKWNPELKRRWLNLKADWRQARNADDRYVGRPAIGSWAERDEAREVA